MGVSRENIHAALARGAEPRLRMTFWFNEEESNFNSMILCSVIMHLWFITFLHTRALLCGRGWELLLGLLRSKGQQTLDELVHSQPSDAAEATPNRHSDYAELRCKIERVSWVTALQIIAFLSVLELLVLNYLHTRMIDLFLRHLDTHLKFWVSVALESIQILY